MRWKRKEDGKYERVPVPRPMVVKEYNRYMGRVDTSDQMLGTNSVHRKTKRWYMTVFQHMLDIAVTNSYIVSKKLLATWHEKPMTRQQFQEELCAQLLNSPSNQPEKPLQPISSGHIPVAISQGQDKTMRATKGRRRCVRCKRSTPWMCEVCEVGLCLQLERNCFRLFHIDPGAQ